MTDSDPEPHRKLRRSTRVPIRVRIEVGPRRTGFYGETVVVSLHGALITTSESLQLGDQIILHVLLTGKSAQAKVVSVDAGDVHSVGVELTQPQNIWGISFPPDDWEGFQPD